MPTPAPAPQPTSRRPTSRRRAAAWPLAGLALLLAPAAVTSALPATAQPRAEVPAIHEGTRGNATVRLAQAGPSSAYGEGRAPSGQRPYAPHTYPAQRYTQQPYAQQYMGPQGEQGGAAGRGQGYGYRSGAGAGQSGMGPHSGSYYGMHHGTAPGAFPQWDPQYGPQYGPQHGPPYGQPYTPQQGLQYGRGSPILQPGWAGVFHLVDRDGDGLVQADEAASRHEARFEMLDGDGDGSLTEREFLEAPRGGAPLAASRAKGSVAAEELGSRMTVRQKRRQEWRHERFRSLDADGDGSVSRSEFMTAGEQRFSAADLDNDGSVTVWEFRAQRRD